MEVEIFEVWHDVVKYICISIYTKDMNDEIIYAMSAN